jgi:hypothetical protein
MLWIFDLFQFDHLMDELNHYKLILFDKTNVKMITSVDHNCRQHIDTDHRMVCKVCIRCDGCLFRLLTQTLQIIVIIDIFIDNCTSLGVL